MPEGLQNKNLSGLTNTIITILVNIFAIYCELKCLPFLPSNLYYLPNITRSFMSPLGLTLWTCVSLGWKTTLSLKF